MINSIQEKLDLGLILNQNEAYNLLDSIINGDFSDEEIAYILSTFNQREVHFEEIKGFRKVLLEKAKKVDFSDFETIDLCGTGGDGKNTFNISTITSFVVGGAGYKVAKHGNYGVSSVSGSSNVLEFLGYKFTNDEEVLKKQLDEFNICFLHAPLFHSAMKSVAPVRKKLKRRTFFNILGPLVNPSSPTHQMVGVSNLATSRIYEHTFSDTSINYGIVFSMDGYDEISLTSDFSFISKNKNTIYSPREIGFNKLNQNDITGGDTIEENGKIFVDILIGKGTKEQNEVVLGNAAMAIHLITRKSLEICKEEVEKSIFDLKAFKILEKITS